MIINKDSYINNALIAIDRTCEYVPLIDTIAAGVNLLAKGLFTAMNWHNSAKVSPYVAYIMHKDTTRTLFHLVPVIGWGSFFAEDLVKDLSASSKCCVIDGTLPHNDQTEKHLETCKNHIRNELTTKPMTEIEEQVAILTGNLRYDLADEFQTWFHEEQMRYQKDAVQAVRDLLSDKGFWDQMKREKPVSEILANRQKKLAKALSPLTSKSRERIGHYFSFKLTEHHDKYTGKERCGIEEMFQRLEGFFEPRILNASKQYVLERARHQTLRNKYLGWVRQNIQINLDTLKADCRKLPKPLADKLHAEITQMVSQRAGSGTE